MNVELKVRLRLLSIMLELTLASGRTLGATGRRHIRLMPQHESRSLSDDRSNAAASACLLLKVVGITLLTFGPRHLCISGSVLIELIAVTVELLTIETDDISAGVTMGSVLVPAERYVFGGDWRANGWHGQHSATTARALSGDSEVSDCMS